MLFKTRFSALLVFGSLVSGVALATVTWSPPPARLVVASSADLVWETFDAGVQVSCPTQALQAVGSGPQDLIGGLALPGIEECSTVYRIKLTNIVLEGTADEEPFDAEIAELIINLTADRTVEGGVDILAEIGDVSSILEEIALAGAGTLSSGEAASLGAAIDNGSSAWEDADDDGIVDPSERSLGVVGYSN